MKRRDGNGQFATRVLSMPEVEGSAVAQFIAGNPMEIFVAQADPFDLVLPAAAAFASGDNAVDGPIFNAVVHDGGWSVETTRWG
jgi:hypothetical protein